MTDDFKEQIRERAGVSGGCRNYKNIDQPEFLTPVSTTEAVGIIDTSDPSNGEIKRRVREMAPDGMYVGIHETTHPSAREIMRGGFSRSRSGTLTPAARGVREGKVYSWHFAQQAEDIGAATPERMAEYENGPIMGDRIVGVIVAAPREETIVSDMTAAVRQNQQTYEERYTTTYPEFIRCLRKSDTKPKLHGLPLTEDDLVQDIEGYSP